jgi:hypothetical protein
LSQSTRKLRMSVLIAMIGALVLGLFAAQPANAIGPATVGPPTPQTAAGDHVFLAAPAGAEEVFRSLDDNTAGSLAIAATDDPSTIQDPNPSTVPVTVVNGERITIEVSDGNGDNCNPLSNGTQYIGFSELPTVVPIGGNASFTAQLSSSTGQNNLRGDIHGCSAPFTPTVQDQLILTVVDAPNAGGTVDAILITGIKYDVGSQAAPGFAQLRWADDVPATDPVNRPAVNPFPCEDNVDRGYADSGGGPLGPFNTCTPVLNSNAWITNLMVDTSAASAIRPGANRALGDITFTETAFDATTPDSDANDPHQNGVCIELQGPTVVHFVDPGTVDVTAGSDVAGDPVIINDNLLRIPFTSSDPATKSTFVLSGVLVNTNDFGRQTMIVYQCEEDGSGNPITDPSNDPGANSVTEYTNPETPRLLVIVVGSERYAGTNRNDTARIIGDRFAECADFVIVARNDDFADALAASYVSGTLYYAPILLVNSHGPIPPETQDAIRRLGATDVFIMGLQTAVGDEVAQQIDGLTSFECGGGAARRTPEDQVRTVNVQRIGGSTRFGTARQAGLFNPGGITIGRINTSGDPSLPPLRTMILANGRNFPDAQVAGPMAFQGNSCRFTGQNQDCLGFPLLLTDANATSLPADTDAFITERNVEQVIIVGGTGAVPAEIQTGLESRGINVIRLGGDTRQLTAIEVAKFEYQWLQFGIQCCFGPHGQVGLARGDFFTDSLTFGPFAGAMSMPILLTQDPNTVGADTDAFLNTISGDWGDDATGGQLILDNLNEPPDAFGFSVFFIHIPGGLVAVSQAAEQEALDALIG